MTELFAIYSIKDDATRTERFESYKEAYNFIYRESGGIEGCYKIIRVSE